ncbi:TPT domain-containing protein [Mycena chlorophos]|uniref:GDP-mannose transporter n=1 Tax=Mycena chlorophos TaxID=658473 RepID=A0A8H6SS78_MYCCL|nr:TPT domain-containing protein [Mycena chlorophos]
MQPRQPESSELEVFGVVSFYISAALVMVFVNKAVLNHTPDLPLTFLWVQVTVAVLLLRLLAYLNQTRFAAHVPEFKLPMLNWVVARNLLSYLTVGLVGLVFNTLCLAGVDAAFFQASFILEIARGLLLPFTIALSALQLKARPGREILFAAVIVTVGFVIGSVPSFTHKVMASADGRITHESAMGLIYGTISSFVLSVHAVLKKRALGHVEQSVITLSYWGNLFMMIALFLCMSLTGEIATLHAKYHDPKMQWRPFIVGSLVTGVFGFLLNISNSLSIKVTSPITHMFSSASFFSLRCVFVADPVFVQAAKGVIQTLLGMWIFGDIMTGSRVWSISTITAGTVYYTYVQTRPKPKPRFPTLPSTTNDLDKLALNNATDTAISGEKKTFEGKPGWVVTGWTAGLDEKEKRVSYVNEEKQGDEMKA